MNAEPSVPRAAATVILLRSGGEHRRRATDPAAPGREAEEAAGLEVLLVKRNPEASFMPGVWVFPGGAVDPGDGGADDEAAHRACAARELHEEAGIELRDGAELVLYSRWITPEFVAVRFDTRFYIALAPAHSPPRPDGAETVDAGWYEPARALELHAADKLELVFPTIKHLESLARYRSADQALAGAREREVEPVLPRIAGEGDERRVVLPDGWA
jgi:8-oxo-dGTP pyrophosphatase MutT (NUDIX family)